MYVCTLERYYDPAYFRLHQLEFEPLGSAVAPNPTSFKNGILGQKDRVSHWTDKIIYEAALMREKKGTMFCSVCKNWKMESLHVKGS